MNRNLAKKKKTSYRTYGFWAVIILLTLLFVGFVVVKFVETRNIQTMDDISNLSEQQIFNQEGTYYVYIYSKVGITEEKTELDRHDEIVDAIESYLNYAKANKANKLYGMIVDSGSDNYGNYGALVTGPNDTNVVGATSFGLFKINKKDVPMMVKITNGRVSAQYITESSIREELELAKEK